MYRYTWTYIHSHSGTHTYIHTHRYIYIHAHRHAEIHTNEYLQSVNIRTKCVHIDINASLHTRLTQRYIHGDRGTVSPTDLHMCYIDMDTVHQKTRFQPFRWWHAPNPHYGHMHTELYKCTCTYRHIKCTCRCTLRCQVYTSHKCTSTQHPQYTKVRDIHIYLQTMQT